MFALAAVRAGRELRREPRRVHQLQPERELAGPAGGLRTLRVIGCAEQREPVAEQVEDVAVPLAGVEQPQDRVAGARRAIQRCRVRAQAPGSRRSSRRP